MQKEYGMQAVQKPPGYEAALEAWRRQWLPLLVFADVWIAALRVVACLPAMSLPFVITGRRSWRDAMHKCICY